MDSVEESAPSPPELDMAFMVEKYHALPDAGGLYEQDARLMRRMSGVMNIYKALSRWRTLTGKQVHQLTEGERKILRLLKDMGLLFN